MDPHSPGSHGPAVHSVASRRRRLSRCGMFGHDFARMTTLDAARRAAASDALRPRHRDRSRSDGPHIRARRLATHHADACSEFPKPRPAPLRPMEPTPGRNARKRAGMTRTTPTMGVRQKQKTTASWEGSRTGHDARGYCDSRAHNPPFAGSVRLHHHPPPTSRPSTLRSSSPISCELDRRTLRDPWGDR